MLFEPTMVTLLALPARLNRKILSCMLPPDVPRQLRWQNTANDRASRFEPSARCSRSSWAYLVWSSKIICTCTPRAMADSSRSADGLSENENTAILIFDPGGEAATELFTCVKIRRCWAFVPIGRLNVAPVTGVYVDVVAAAGVARSGRAPATRNAVRAKAA